MITCPNCNGTGEIEGPKSVPPVLQEIKMCPTCKGKKRTEDKYKYWEICPKCDGYGILEPLALSPRCTCCNGVGMVTPSKAAKCKKH